MVLLILCLLLLGLPGKVFAQEKERAFFQAPRALSMGDAYTAYGDGFEGPFYNPAGLALKQELELKLIDVNFIGSQDFAIFGKNVATKLTSLPSLIRDIQENGGKNYSLGVGFLPQLLVKNFSIGVVARSFGEGKILENSNLDLYAFTDIGAYVQSAVAFGGGILKIGGGIKLLDRAEISKVYRAGTYESGQLEFGNEWREGVGIGYDVGAILTIPVTFLPKFAVSFQDLGGTRFEDQQLLFKKNKSAEGPPSEIRQRVNAGVGLKIKHGRNVQSNIMGDLKDLSQAFNPPMHSTTTDYIHGGWELNVRDILFLRAGVNQGRYWTGGMGLHVGGLGMELATYGENVAFKGNPRVDDRKISFRFFFLL